MKYLRLLHNLLYSCSLHAYINNLSLLVRMYKLIRMLPTPLLLAFSNSSVINVTDNAARGYPYDGSNNYNSSYYIIFQESHNFVNVYVLDNVPEPFHYILNCLLTNTLEVNCNCYFKITTR